MVYDAGKKWVSFQRIRLHLYRIFPEQGLPLAEQAFRNPEILDRASLQHEGVLLLKSSFQAFSPDSQKALLEWIDRGRSGESIRRWLEFVEQPVTEENIQQLSNIWRRDRYAMLASQLPEPYQRKLEELVTIAGEARVLEKPLRITGGAVGAQSPKSPEELDGMNANEIVAFLGTWIPGTGMFQPTAEGMSQQLAALVTKRPGEFADIARKFRSLDPTYVRALLGGLTNALKQKSSFDWKPVLDLAAWVTSQPREMPGRKGGLMIADPDWGWTRDAVIDLLSTGFEVDQPVRLPYDRRVATWTVLRPLTEDPNPSVQDEGGEKFDPASLSINSTRGRAIHATVSYARWVRLSTDASRKAQEQPPITFAEMPEVQEALEAHLDVAREPTRTIRAVYGDHLTLLAFLDWGWVRRNIARILPTGDGDEGLFRAAWNSFVVFNWPNTALLPDLIRAYRRAVAGLGKSTEKKRYPRSPEDSLAEHLLVYYWLGKLEFGGEDRLLDDFYARASGDVRGHAIWFIGTSVAGWKDD